VAPPQPGAPPGFEASGRKRVLGTSPGVCPGTPKASPPASPALPWAKACAAADGFGHDRPERRPLHRPRTHLPGKPCRRGDRGGSHPSSTSWAGSKRVSLALALHGGDDYELLFTAAAAVPVQIAGVRVTRIGQIVGSTGMRLIGADGTPQPLEAGGWEHFRGKS